MGHCDVGIERECYRDESQQKHRTQKSHTCTSMASLFVRVNNLRHGGRLPSWGTNLSAQTAVPATPGKHQKQCSLKR
jgi:hypothetical protein